MSTWDKAQLEKKLQETARELNQSPEEAERFGPKITPIADAEKLATESPNKEESIVTPINHFMSFFK